MTVNDALNYGKNYLKEKGIPSYALDSKVLLMNVLNMTKVELFLKYDLEIPESDLGKFKSFILQRGDFRPVQYITGNAEFMGLNFKVNEHTLIPRGDTELLVECVTDYIKDKNLRVLDIGTGSGIIPVCIKKFCKNAVVTSVDISENALIIAKENAKINNVDINLFKSNLFENIQDKYDIIVSNPPYIESDVIPTLEPNVKDYEPLTALDGGVDGLDFYRLIIKDSYKYLNKNAMIFFEIGYNQGISVPTLLKENNFTDIVVKKDYAQDDRVVFAKIIN